MLLSPFLSLSWSLNYPNETNQCSNLTYVFSDGNLKITGIGEVIGTCIDPFRSNITGTVTLGRGITAIGYWAFHHLQSWVSFTFPHTLESIGPYCFEGTNISSIRFPTSLRSLGDKAFLRSTFNSTQIRIHSALDIGANAFMFATGITAFEVGGPHPDFANDSIGCLYSKNHTIFFYFPSGCPLPRFVLPSTVTTIGLRSPPDVRGDRVHWSQQLARVLITPGNVQFTTDDNGFLYNGNKTVLYLVPPGRQYTKCVVPAGVTELWGASLAGVTAGRVVFPDGLRLVGQSSMFRINVSEIVLPDSVEMIHPMAFVEATTKRLSLGGSLGFVARPAFAGSAIEILHWRGAEPPDRIVCSGFRDFENVTITVPPKSDVKEFCGWTVSDTPSEEL
jgi:hypothetical protein